MTLLQFKRKQFPTTLPVKTPLQLVPTQSALQKELIEKNKAQAREMLLAIKITLAQRPR